MGMFRKVFKYGCLIPTGVVIAFIVLSFVFFRGCQQLLLNDAATIMSGLHPGMGEKEVQAFLKPYQNHNWRKAHVYFDKDNPPDPENKAAYSGIVASLHRDYQIYIYLVYDLSAQTLQKALRVDFGDNGQMWIEDIRGDDRNMMYHKFAGFTKAGKIQTGEFVKKRY